MHCGSLLCAAAPSSGERHALVDRRALVGGAVLALSSTAGLRPAKAENDKPQSEVAEVLPQPAAAAAADGVSAQSDEFDVDVEVPGRRLRKPPPPLPKAALTKGLDVSKIIRGGWQLSGGHRGAVVTDRTRGPEALADMDTMFQAGMTSVDTADVYGSSEVMIGQYLRLYPWRRENMQVLTKITVGSDDVEALSANLVEYKVRASVRRLGTHYVDLLQLHWDADTSPANMRKAVDTMLWLRDLQAKDGLVRHLGVVNFSAPALLQLIDAGIKPASNQVQYSVLDRRPDLHLQAVCQRHGVAILPYGVLAGGFLADRYLGVPSTEAKLNTLSKQKYGTQIAAMGGWSWLQELLLVLRRVGKKHRATVSQVAVRWVLDQPCVPAAIVGARNATHLKDLQRALAVKLDDDDVLDIDAAVEGAKQPQHDVYEWERGGDW